MDNSTHTEEAATAKRYLVILAERSYKQKVIFRGRSVRRYFMSTEYVLARSPEEAMIVASESLGAGRHRPVKALLIDEVKDIATALESCTLTEVSPVIASFGTYVSSAELELMATAKSEYPF